MTFRGSLTANMPPIGTGEAGHSAGSDDLGFIGRAQFFTAHEVPPFLETDIEVTPDYGEDQLLL